MPEEKTGQIQKIPVGHGTDSGQVVGDMTASIQSFFISSQFSDLVIKTEEQEFKVHRLIVCGQSEYFARLYKGNWTETADNTIQLNDDDPRAIEAMIHFMYGIDYDSDLGRVSPMIFNIRLYQVADKYFLALAWAFLPDEPELRQGLIIVGLARCIAMVLIWTGLAGGDSEYCAILVAFNSLLQMVLFAPLGVFFINVISGDSVTFEYAAAAKSVAVFLGIPLGSAILTRFSLRFMVSKTWYDQIFLKWIGPWSLIGLLFTILVLFASQGRHVVHQIVSVIRVAAPLVVYFIVIFFTTLFVAYRLGFGYKLAATQSFTAASNNFELAIAVAVATFGANSNQALASTVGPLIEVPVLLGLVYAVKLIAKRAGWKD